MSEADLGVRVFLIDNLSSPMGLLTGSLAMLGAGLMSGMAQSEGMGQKLRMLENDANNLSNDFLAGNMTLQEYNDKMAANSVASQQLAADQAALNSQIALMGGTLGAGVDFFAFAEGIKSADQAASDLDTTLQNVSIAGNLTNAQFGQMKQYLMEVAQTSIFSADTVGQGFTMLLERGFSLDDIIKGLGADTINMAEAMGEQNATGAATLLAGTMQMFQLKGNEARQTADQLTYAFYHGVPSVEGLTAALNATGGMAHAMHVPLSELLVMLDNLGKAGLSGSQGGTAFRYMLQSMYEPTQKQANELQTLGIITAKQVTPAFEKFLSTMNGASAAAGSASMKFDGTVNSLYQIFKNAQQIGTLPASATFLQWADSLGMLSNKFYDAKGNQIDFFKAYTILVKALKDHSKDPQAFSDALGQMFNVRSGQGFSDILGKVGGLTLEQQKLKDAMHNQGLAAEDAAKKTGTQAGAIAAFKTTLTDFMAQVGQPFADMVTGMFQKLNTFIGQFTTGSPAVHNFMTAFLAVGAVLSGLGLLVGLAIIIGGVFTTVVGVALAPFIAVALGIVAAAAGIALAFMWIKSNIALVMAFLKPFIQTLGNMFKSMDFQTTINDLKKAFTELLPALKIVGMVLGGVILAAIIIVIAAISGLAVAIGFLVKGALLVLQGAIQMVSGVLNVFVGIIKIVWGVISIAGYVVLAIFTGHWEKVRDAVKLTQEGLSQFGTGVLQILTGMWSAVKGLFVGSIGAIVGFVAGFISGIINFFQGLANTLVHHSIIPDMINAIVQWFLHLPIMVAAIMVQFIYAVIRGANMVAHAFQSGIVAPIESMLGGLAGMAVQWGVNIMQGFINGVTSMIGNLKNAVGNAVAGVKSFLGFHSPTKEGPGSDADTWAPNLMKMMVSGVVGGTPSLRDAAHGAATALRSGFTSPTVQGLQSSAAYGSGSSTGGATTVQLMMDSKCVGEAVIDRMTGQLVSAGINRAGR